MSDSDQQAAAPQDVAPAAAAPAAAAPQDAAPQAIPAVGFLVVAFTDAVSADQTLDAMKDAKRQGAFYFEDAAVITQDAQGKVKYHETGDMSAGKGAGIGALVGGVIGILAGPAGVALGAGVGAAIGGAVASADRAFKKETLGPVAVALKPGTSAVAVITSHHFANAVQQQLVIEDIDAAVGDLAAKLSARLAEHKNVAIGLLLTKQGLTIKEIAINDESAEVVRALITGDAAAVGAAVVTAEVAMGEAGVVTDEGAVVVDAVATPAEPAADATKS